MPNFYTAIVRFERNTVYNQTSEEVEEVTSGIIFSLLRILTSGNVRKNLELATDSYEELYGLLEEVSLEYHRVLFSKNQDGRAEAMDACFSHLKEVLEEWDSFYSIPTWTISITKVKDG